ncbi:MAG: DUF2149 domain-containing protein [Desulfotomaculaceae bacterium]|nr:DUF2149 domain-containing protein [Desulfotomaculaceae bacterium]MDD4767716.1 DUF2149 domain-containing protein [Desulfotomaculaceae bacterium]
MNGGLRSRGRLRDREEINPLEGAINIVDAMLVFACGLMLALVINWNVDLTSRGERINLDRGQELTEEPGIRDDLVESEEGQGKPYQKMGTVYKDPETGKLFMLTNQQ